jgi:hypothetical protein
MAIVIGKRCNTADGRLDGEQAGKPEASAIRADLP